jgi:quinol monooxygenase YgiN
MAVYSLVRFAVRADARETVERALHDHASFVRRDLAAVTWTAYRDPEAPLHFTALVRSEDATASRREREAFVTTITPHLDGALVVEGCDLVTSSDLGRRHR